MKKCNHCNITKSINDFPKKTSSPDGHYTFCRQCKAIKDKAYREANKQKLKVKAKEYAYRNSEGIALKNKLKYHSASPEEVEIRKEKKRVYNLNAPASVKERKRSYDRDYFASEAGKLVTTRSIHKRRAQKLSSSDESITNKALQALKMSQNFECAYCSKLLDFSIPFSVHLDHVIPLSKGGKHTLNNVVCSCASCNLKKSSTIVDALH